VDAARARGADKRGGGALKANLEETAVLSPEPGAAIVDLDDALVALARIAPRQAKVVELRYFGGLSVAQTVEAMGTSERTVMRDWEFAKAWLSRELSR
jgi:RNA polymerase sigma factor (TIGR02999 family)